MYVYTHSPLWTLPYYTALCMYVYPLPLPHYSRSISEPYPTILVPPHKSWSTCKSSSNIQICKRIGYAYISNLNSIIYQYKSYIIILWNGATLHRFTHDYQVTCLHECQVVIMCAYEVASMHVSKPCYINMYLSIDEPFRFNISLRHILVNLALVVNTLSNSSCSLSFLSYLSHLILFFILKLIPSFGLNS